MALRTILTQGEDALAKKCRVVTNFDERLHTLLDDMKETLIASGGAGSIQDFVTLFNEIPTIDAGLAASIFHFGEVKISDLKDTLDKEGIVVRK